MVVLHWFCLGSLATLRCRVSCKSGSVQQLENSPLAPRILSSWASLWYGGHIGPREEGQKVAGSSEA